MLEIIVLVAVIILVVVSIKLINGKRDLNETRSLIEQEKYKAMKKPESANTNTDKYVALEKIKALLDSGVLTEDEFQSEKKSILAGIKTNLSGPSQQVNNDPVSALTQGEIIDELSRKGYRVKNKGSGKYKVIEPMGGIHSCASYEDLEDYARGILAR